MTNAQYVDEAAARAARLIELEHKRYGLEDRIKEIGRQLKEMSEGHARRMAVLIDERKREAANLEKVNAEAAQLRNEKH